MMRISDSKSFSSDAERNAWPRMLGKDNGNYRNYRDYIRIIGYILGLYVGIMEKKVKLPFRV